MDCYYSQTKDGNTVLMMAVYQQNPAVVSLLIGAGADVDITNKVSSHSQLLYQLGAHKAHTRLVLSNYIPTSVCMCVCVSVCSSTIITCAKLRHSVTMPL